MTDVLENYQKEKEAFPADVTWTAY
jgi:hypothetical protein